jgi:hypothetical protein
VCGTQGRLRGCKETSPCAGTRSLHESIDLTQSTNVRQKNNARPSLDSLQSEGSRLTVDVAARRVHGGLEQQIQAGWAPPLAFPKHPHVV